MPAYDNSAVARIADHPEWKHDDVFVIWHADVYIVILHNSCYSQDTV